MNTIQRKTIRHISTISALVMISLASFTYLDRPTLRVWETYRAHHYQRGASANIPIINIAGVSPLVSYNLRIKTSKVPSLCGFNLSFSSGI